MCCWNAHISNEPGLQMPGINMISHLIHQKTKSFELYHPHEFYSTIILLYFNNSLYFYYDNSRRHRHGNVHDNVKVFGLGRIDLLHRCYCGRASTETCYCQYIHNMLLWACKKYCWTYVWNKPHIAYINHPASDLYMWSWGRWRASEACCNCYSKR